MAKQIFPCLWFVSEAQAAAEYYCSIFPNSKITASNPVAVEFELNGKKHLALNGRPAGFGFNDSFSIVVQCDSQQEIDNYWERLTADGGRESMCGWCIDKFGVSWQIVPAILGELLSQQDKAQQVVQVLMTMKKLDINALKNA